VLRHIVAETGGKLWSPEYKPELLDAVSPWNVEYILNTETGMRTIRSNYISQVLPQFSPFNQPLDTSELWKEIDKEFGVIGEERGEYHSRVSEECPYGYISDRGHQMMTELDQFPERTSEKELVTWIQQLIYLQFGLMQKGYPGFITTDVGEPWMSTCPEVGPDTYMLLRAYKEITDPKGVIAPRRDVYTSDEFKALMKEPGTMIRQIFAMRDKLGLPKLELTPEGDRWEPTE